MTFVIGFTDVKKRLNKDAPACELDHLLADDLFLKAVPVIGKVFYDKDIPGANGIHPHQELKHDDHRLTLVEGSLDQYLDGYTPKDTDRDGEYRREKPKIAFKGPMESEEMEKHFQRQLEKEAREREGHLKYAAFKLREIVEYAMKNQRNIQVN